MVYRHEIDEEDDDDSSGIQAVEDGFTDSLQFHLEPDMPSSSSLSSSSSSNTPNHHDVVVENISDYENPVRQRMLLIQSIYFNVIYFFVLLNLYIHSKFLTIRTTYHLNIQMISDNISSSYFFCFPQCLSISTWSI
jgi:hypothetical protein